MASTFAKNNQTNGTVKTEIIAADPSAEFDSVTIFFRCDKDSIAPLLIQVEPLHGNGTSTTDSYDQLDKGEYAYYTVNNVGMPAVNVRSPGSTTRFSYSVSTAGQGGRNGRSNAFCYG